ncbi:MAG: hypothetical protein JW753_05435 [Dehalococcoidia bacterium]|nr:hypothetical protein [Dehalococcoidia bacterium]
MNSKDQRPQVFYTDAEFEAAFGAQAAAAVRMLSKYAEGVCRECGGECCRRIQCEFYSDLFPACPIFDYRPAKCRLYFCERILENKALSESEREILNQPAVELSQALRRGWGLGIFIEPPVKVGDKTWLTELGIDTEVDAVIALLGKGAIDAESARSVLLGLVMRCRRDV